MTQLTYGLVQRAKPGNLVSGDALLVHAAGERTLVLIADGLGSGEVARLASDAALDALPALDQRPVETILAGLHEALRGTRGAAIGLLAIHPAEQRLEYAGIGNIEVRTRREWGFSPLSLRGVVGYGEWRPPRVFATPYPPGEWLVLHSDGLKSRFDLSYELLLAGRASSSPQAVAEDLAERFARVTDDLTLLVIELP